MAGTGDPIALRLGGGGHYRLQGLAVQRLTLAQIGGFVNPAGRFCAGDPQTVGQRWGQLAAQFDGISLFAELVDQRVLDGGQAAPNPFATFQQGQVFGRGQRVAPQIQGAFQVSPQRVDDLDDLFPTTRTHVRIVASGSDI